MHAQNWNDEYRIGSRVDVRLANGQKFCTRTTGLARCWGGLDHIQVAGMTGFVLLTWVRPTPGAGSDAKCLS